jgi:hypothetical protein
LVVVVVLLLGGPGGADVGPAFVVVFSVVVCSVGGARALGGGWSGLRWPAAAAHAADARADAALLALLLREHVESCGVLVGVEGVLE